MSLKTYLVEAYMSKAVTDGPAGMADRAVLATEQLRREGTAVRYLRGMFITQDETYFHIFEANGEEDVRKAAARAGIHAERVLEAATFEGLDPTLRHAGQLSKEER